jgi:hypothetical protein
MVPKISQRLMSGRETVVLVMLGVVARADTGEGNELHRATCREKRRRIQIVRMGQPCLRANARDIESPACR